MRHEHLCFCGVVRIVKGARDCKDVVQSDKKRQRLLGDDVYLVERKHHRYMVCPCQREEMRCSVQGGTGEGKSVGCTLARLSSIFLAVLTFWAVESVVPPEE